MPTNNIINITEEQFFCYIRCPAEYDMKYNKKIGVYEKKTIRDLLLTVNNYFYMSLLDNKMPKLNELVTKYEKAYIKCQDDITELKYKDGLFLLRNFYNYAMDNQLSVVNIGYQYQLPYKNIVLRGLTSPIAVDKNKNLELFIANYSNKNIDRLDLDMKLKYTIDMYVAKEDDIDIKAIKNVSFKSLKTETSTRMDNDYNRLLTAIEGVGNGIDKQIFYPRESTFCSSCSYRYHCRGWR